MSKTVDLHKVTKNVRVYGDSHEIISDYAKSTHQTIAGLVHQFALSLPNAKKFLQ